MTFCVFTLFVSSLESGDTLSVSEDAFVCASQKIKGYYFVYLCVSTQELMDNKPT